MRRVKGTPFGMNDLCEADVIDVADDDSGLTVAM
jgi:hypothetical protein